MVGPWHASQFLPQAKIYPKKLLVSVWWTTAGVVNYSFLKSDQAFTAEVYCQQLQTMMEKLAVKQPRLINSSTPLILHDNARPYLVQQTATKLGEV
jgi:hypothetical protein